MHARKSRIAATAVVALLSVMGVAACGSDEHNKS
jgi:hypothetical protein